MNCVGLRVPYIAYVDLRGFQVLACLRGCFSFWIVLPYLYTTMELVMILKGNGDMDVLVGFEQAVRK